MTNTEGESSVSVQPKFAELGRNSYSNEIEN